ncbi:hypothetical protein [Marinifilum flexuosum]|uniref:hypothetical protein n=1 Tax=Marinifilum flexuosum TaxID=1117708 RepID=UPI002493DB69|nr:hypothetical protein [Marinifilum flexuosum]
MKKGNCFWNVLFFFIIGVLFCYLSLKIKFFEIDFKLNVVNSTISIGTALIGLYIAITIQRKINQGQNNYLFIRDKIENLWINFNAFSDQLKSSQSIPLSNLNQFIKNTYGSLGFVTSIYESFELNKDLIEDLDMKIDELESLLNTTISNNIIDLVPERSNVHIKVREINDCFVRILKQISDL